jgi:hypothetical protein
MVHRMAENWFSAGYNHQAAAMPPAAINTRSLLSHRPGIQSVRAIMSLL